MNRTDYNGLTSMYTPAAYFASPIPRLNLEGGFQGYFYVWSHAFSPISKPLKKLQIMKKMSKMPGMDVKGLIKEIRARFQDDDDSFPNSSITRLATARS